MKKITVLGATGSIGGNTLDVIRRNPDRYSLYAASCHKNHAAMARIIREFAPAVAVATDREAYGKLREFAAASGCRTDILFGEENLCAVAASEEYDGLMSAIVGAAGLKPTLAAISRGRTVYLANKESLVMSGHILMNAARRYKAAIIPVDSEHSAIFQCLPEREQRRVGRCDLKGAGIVGLILTGSGGPFRDRDPATLDAVTPAEAVSHPNWSMGRKISVDSATMMNKGLEFIEARWLFNADPADIKIVVHPESVIHSMVRYADGAVLAQLGAPDMRTPIARALAYPDRIDGGAPALDFAAAGPLTFREPDFARYPCLGLAIEACRVSQAVTTALNAANEVAVGAFLDGKIKFTDIYRVCAKVAPGFAAAGVPDLESVLEVDAQARARAFGELSLLA